MRLLFVILVVSFDWTFGVRAPPGSCPPVCSCKWKSGKQTVECVDRGLITIPELVDPATQVLDMSGNNLQILPRETFQRNELTNLQKVYLRNCKLGQIDAQAFKGLTNLVELDLSYNVLTHVPTATFSDVPYLRLLVLAHNPIQRVNSDGLRTLKNIVNLDLSNCELRELSNSAFKNNHLLETLKLNGNDLKELPSGVLEGLKRLRVVELYDNPWTCDCRLRELKIWLTDHNVPSTVAARCASPPRLAERPFSELTTDEFACKPEILPASRHVESVTGENATIVCRAEAIPPANVNWYWNSRLLMNNTIFSNHQKIFILEDGVFLKHSTLVITNAQEIDSGEFYCVAENKAGSSEANFTLHVLVRAAGMATLSGATMVGLGAVLFFVIIVVLAAILLFLIRSRTTNECDSKTPGRIDCVVSANTNTIDKTCSSRDHNPSIAMESNDCNPIQKPPRVADISYTVNQFDGRGSIVSALGPPLTSPTLSIGNNPDLINDTRSDSVTRPGSGEYAREGSESLYPSGLWEQNAREGLARATSTALPAYYSDRTPIMESCSVEGSQEELSFSSKTFPRSHISHGGYPPDYGLPIVTPQPMGPPINPNAKTLRVWQRNPPVLPPVTALKRALVTSRRSPDEGYQEGCGTDV